MSKNSIGKIRAIQIKSALSLAIILIASTLSGCQSVNLSDLQEILSTSNLPITAAEFCTQSGGQIQIRAQENLDPFNVCIFPDGSQCVDEAFQSGNCQAGRYFGSQAADDITAIAAPFCEMNGGTWQYRTGAQNDPKAHACSTTIRNVMALPSIAVSVAQEKPSLHKVHMDRKGQPIWPTRHHNIVNRMAAPSNSG